MPRKNSIFDIATGVIVRDWLKHLMAMGLDRAERRAPTLFNTLAWMHLRPEGQTAKKWFQGAIVVTGTWLDWLASRTTMFGQLKEVVEATFQDMPGSFSAYFERRESSIVIPEDFVGPQTEEDVKKLIKDFQAFVGTEVSTDLPGLLGNFKASRWASQASTFYRTLIAAEDSVMVWMFLNYFDSLTLQDQDDFLQSIEYFNDPLEFQRFMQSSPDMRKKMIDMAVRLRNLGLLPTISRWYHENRPKFDAFADRIFKATGDEIGGWADSVEAENAIRRLEIGQRRAVYVKPQRPWIQPWVRWVVGLPLVFALMALLTLKGCEMASDRKVKNDTRNAAMAQRDSLDEVRRAMIAEKEYYKNLADSLARTPSGFVGDSASTRRR